MRPMLKVLNIVAPLFVLVLQACAMLPAEPAAPLALPTPSSVAALPTPTRNLSVALVPTAPAPAPTPLAAARWAAETFVAHVGEGLTGYNMADGQTLFRLPPGRLSADGNVYISAEPVTANNQAATQLGAYDAGAGYRLANRLVSNGRWALGAVSANGRWAALNRVPSDADKAAWTKANTWQTDLEVFDMRAQSGAHIIQLAGNFDVDGLSTNGSSLYLIEHVPAIHPEHYRVRLYNLWDDSLQPGALVDKNSPPDEVMTGYAWGAVGTPNGAWLLTLYLDTQRHSAFVHALNLRDQFAFCVDLPSGSGDFQALKQYALTLSPSANTLYASNAALGLVSRISLSGTIELSRTDRFDAIGFVTPPSVDAGAPAARSVISGDGAKLYFSSGWDVWAYDTRAGAVNGPTLSSARIADMGLSADGARLYLAREQLPLSVVDVASGQELRFPVLAGR